jgi:chemotaxis signal transduction protein
MSELGEIDLVVFEVGGSRFAADLTQVRRIDIDEPTESVGHPLGAPLKGSRALVFGVGRGHERRLAVDVVHGVSRVPVTSLRRMPPAVHAAPFSIGAWLDGDDTVLLVDLISLVPATEEGTSHHGH